MKFTKVFIVGILFFFFSGVSFGQELTYSEAEVLLNDSQKEVLKKADKYLKKGDKKIASAEKIEAKYKKYLEKKNKAKSAKKKKKYQAKFDKKTAEARKIRIQAQKDYLKAYQDATAVYSQIIVGADYFDDADRTEANSLNNSAESLVENAEKEMSKYNKIIGDSKKLKKTKASDINSAISKSKDLLSSAYNKQKEAIDIVLTQGRKKEEAEKDERAWSTAQGIHTIEAYQDYIDNFPSGRHVSSARSNIRMLRAEEAKKNASNAASDYIFKVQIAASISQLPISELRAKYPNTDEIEKVHVGNRYKYWVGAFPTYKEAAALRDQLLTSTVYDAFIVVFDKDGNQLEVTDDMKN
ncbi:MAG: hypothetical protein GXO49_06230 [Chlorobi bacterium]|nr:hypothetical protein [Chlorobiota bacterium]